MLHLHDDAYLCTHCCSRLHPSSDPARRPTSLLLSRLPLVALYLSINRDSLRTQHFDSTPAGIIGRPVTGSPWNPCIFLLAPFRCAPKTGIGSILFAAALLRCGAREPLAEQLL